MRVAPAEPQVSTRGLQFTGFTPIQPLPSIKEVTAQIRTLSQQVMNPQPAAETQNHDVEAQNGKVETQNDGSATQNVDAETQNVASLQPGPDGIMTQNDTTETQNDDAETQNVASPPPAPEETEAQDDTPETFEGCWNQMVDFVFAKKPAFYHQLRDYLPRFENEIIYVDVENDFQKNQLEMSKRPMLEYWRNQFRMNVNDIEFVIHEHERKKVIYTSEDKVNNMLEQNPELKDFLQVLNFRIKD